MKAEAIKRGKPYDDYEVGEEELEYDMTTIYPGDDMTMRHTLNQTIDVAGVNKDVTFEDQAKHQDLHGIGFMKKLEW